MNFCVDGFELVCIDEEVCCWRSWWGWDEFIESVWMDGIWWSVILFLVLRFWCSCIGSWLVNDNFLIFIIYSV